MLPYHRFVPESFRWYWGHDRFKDAENIIKKVAKINGKPAPDMSGIYTIKTSQNDATETNKKYSFLDIVKSRELLKYTVLFIFIWITLGIGGYGIQFGITGLSGDLYINIFVLGLLASPLQFILIYLQNRFGRKKTAAVLYIFCSIATLTVAVAYRFKELSLRNQLTNVAAILALTVITAAWSPIQTLTIETYATVVRNIGFGLQNTMAGVGAVIGPQLVFLETKVPGLLYWVCGVAAVLSIFLMLPIPETIDRDLNDKIFEQTRYKKRHGQSVNDEESMGLAETPEQYNV